MEIKHIKQDNFNLNMLKTSKFKTTVIQVTFASDLNNNTVTPRALLPYILKAVSKKYPTRNKLSAHLEDMYAANFGTGVKKIGLSQIAVFDLSIINDKYTLNNENLFEEGLDFLNEIIFNPLFDETIFSDEKRFLDEYFKGIYANKMRYTIKKMYDTMLKDDPYNIQVLGDETKLQELTLDDCKESYQTMIDNDLININVVGDIDFMEVEELINRTFKFTNRKKQLVLIDDSLKPERNLVEIFESQDVNQGKLAIGYQFPVYYQTDDYYKAIVFNSLVGGSSESLLFKTIREEKSLVYFISSAYDNHKGIFTIFSGINQKDYQEVNNNIDQIIKNTIKGTYDDKALLIAKKSLINSLIESLDSNRSLTSRLNSLSLFDKELDIDKLIANIEKVTKEDITKMGKLLKKDAIFFLRNDQIE